ncbi:MAG TPA: FAD-binding oxidoreductase [Dehalococcoidales bacterium]|nr:FAD-binding oxidoreductase [Dehalococcoidales bacterium]
MVQRTQLVKIAGSKYVFDESPILATYSRDMSSVPEVKPAYVVKLHNAQQVASIIRLAIETGTPLVPVSSGPPHFRGDTVPTTGGSVILDLSGMKNVLNIDRKNRVVMFEPGVTFGELSEAVHQHGMRLNMPLLPRRTKSVLGSLLEREPVVMPAYHWDIADPLACTEVIFGTGEMFRTGAAAGSGSIEEQWAAGGAQKEASGPSSASWYRLIQGSQGSLGVVTWASARCELLPRLESPFFIPANLLTELLEPLHWLVRLRLVNECLILNSTNLKKIMAARGNHTHKVAEPGLPAWILFFNLAAYDFLPEERIQGQTLDMLDLAQRLDVQAVKTLNGFRAEDFLRTVQNPAPDPCWKVAERGNCQDIFFLALLEKIPGMVNKMAALADQIGYSATDMGVYIQPIVQGSNYHCEFNLFFDGNQPEEARRIRQLTAAAVKELLSAGAFFSRPYGEQAALILNRDAATLQALKKVKAIADPHNIMNPGKLGL